MNRQTYLAKNDEVTRNWVVIDGTDQVLGRLSTRIAVILMGKNKPQYTPHCDVGDFVIVTNVDKIRMTGNKGEQKRTMDFSGHTSGLKIRSHGWMLENKPDELLFRSVKRMMPKNKLAHQMLTKLKMYRGSEHPHQAQQPQTLTV